MSMYNNEDNTTNLERDEQSEKIAQQRERTFNGLSATEWASLSNSVWNDVSSVRAKKHLDHGATYPEKLCDRLIAMYSRIGDTILDPFLGTGTTVVSAIKNKRHGIGIELTDRFFSVASESIEYKRTSKGIEVFLEECKDSFSKSASDVEKLNDIVKSKGKADGLKLLFTKIIQQDDIDEIYTSVAAKYSRTMPRFMVDYIFMFSLSSDAEHTYIDYTVAVVNTNLVPLFSPIANNGRLVGRLTYDKIYIIGER